MTNSIGKNGAYFIDKKTKLKAYLKNRRVNK